MRWLSRVMFVVGGVPLMLLAPVSAQVRCAMPNGVLITQQLGGCPKDAVQVPMEGSTQAREIPASNAARPLPQPAQTQARAAAISAKSDDDGGMSFFAWIVVVGLAAALIAAIKGSVGVSGRPLFCTTCGHEGPGKTKTRGSTLIEVILWLCFLVPGLIYSVWRLGSKYKACTSCGGTTLVPPHSPIAKATKKILSGSVAPSEIR